MVSRTLVHAIKALAALAKRPEGAFVAAEEIAQEIGAPRNYLGKLLQILTRAKFVQSKKGLDGGFQLALNPHKTTVYEVMEVIEDTSRWDGCFMGNAHCSSKHACAVHDEWKKARDSYLTFLKKTTIADLLH
jgi:Rrf2 family transcriptional regulator, iron-sulfur cluster assembly transcription factor